jgi:acetyltransferase-like isoleucine patch superfamily enzyme
VVGSIISKDAKIGKKVKIGDYCKIYPNVEIAENSTIGDFCVIGHPTKKEIDGVDFSASRLGEIANKTKIGRNSIIRSGTVIYSNVQIGDNFRTGHGVIIRENTIIGKDCIVGTKAILDGYIKMGKKSFVQSGCYITQSTEIGDFVFIAPNVVTLDNKHIIMGEGLNGPKIGNGVRIGGNTTILPGVKIGDYSLIGGGSVICKDIPAKSLAYGNPVKIIRKLTDQEVKRYIKSLKKW